MWLGQLHHVLELKSDRFPVAKIANEYTVCKEQQQQQHGFEVSWRAENQILTHSYDDVSEVLLAGYIISITLMASYNRLAVNITAG